jgi:fructose-1,6-bisphosphatase/inositol monophosphatase family enzyme
MKLNLLEQSSLSCFRNDRVPDFASFDEELSLVSYGLWALLKIGKLIRSARILPAQISFKNKDDGSPTTDLEKRIEELIIETSRQFFPGLTFVGEESGGELASERVSIVLDPIDGTWSLLSHTESCTTSLAFYRDGHPFIGMVLNPATGELGYAIQGHKTRLIQLSLFAEEDYAVDLPTRQNARSRTWLVNFQPAGNDEKLARALYPLWQQKKVQFVKSTGGSPSWALLEAAKGHFIYINQWGVSPAANYDLAAGILLVRGAGGEVVNEEGSPIPFVGHQGLLIAGVSVDGFPELLSIGYKN